MKNAIQHYWENHAIKPEEMNVRIKDDIIIVETVVKRNCNYTHKRKQ
jgi:hypothetical protein